MIGGQGSDVYIVDNAGDVVIENAGEGIDGVQSWLSAYTLAAEVENLTLGGTASIGGTGNTLDNALLGNSGANALVGSAGNDSLDGGAGDDTLTGGLGNDSYVVDSSLDVVIEAVGEGTDVVRSSVSYGLVAEVENLTLHGFRGHRRHRQRPGQRHLRHHRGESPRWRCRCRHARRRGRRRTLHRRQRRRYRLGGGRTG